MRSRLDFGFRSVGKKAFQLFAMVFMVVTTCHQETHGSAFGKLVGLLVSNGKVARNPSELGLLTLWAAPPGFPLLGNGRAPLIVSSPLGVTVLGSCCPVSENHCFIYSVPFYKNHFRRVYKSGSCCLILAGCGRSVVYLTVLSFPFKIAFKKLKIKVWTFGNTEL